ncbi:MAG TPA: hypothetical protein VFZ51_05865 [Woeseiaceae bacterium]
MRSAWATMFTLVLAGGATAQQAQIRVVDEPTRLGIRYATMTLEVEGRQAALAETDSLGFATLTLPDRRIYTVRVTALGYLEQTREIDFAGVHLSRIPAFVLEPQVLEMPAVEIEARRSSYRGAGARSSRTVAGERIARMRDAGLMLEDAIREMPGVRVTSPRGQLCVELTRGIATFRGNGNACRMVAVVVDGFPYYDAADMLRGATLDNFESVELMSPMEAGFRYGMEASQRGALILWTRGRGPHAAPNAWIRR